MEVPPSEVLYEAPHISVDDSATVVTGIVTCFFVAFIAVALRLLSRRLKHLCLQQDDYAAVIALAFVAGLSANIGIDLYTGLARHTILSNHITTFVKSITATQILYITALVPARLSIIFFYRRLSTSASLSIALWLFSVWVVVLGIAGNLLVIFSCANAPTVNIGAHCIDYSATNLSYGVLDVLTNLALLCWPIQFFWGLEVDRARKAHLVGVFALGGFACAASIIRLINLSNASQIDLTWSATSPTIWSFVELTIGLTASCLATLTPLLRFILPRYSSSFPTTSRRTRSFISDTETAIATPQQPNSRKRAPTISFKVSQTTPPSSSSSKPSTSISKSRRKSSKTKTGASSPGFTWRCSGQPSDLEKWKALPLPPPPLLHPALPEVAHVLTSSMKSVGDLEEGKMEEPAIRPSPVFRPVVYGGRM